VLVDYKGARAVPFGYPKRAQVARHDDGRGGFACLQLDGPLQDDMRLCTEAA
jgi:hypothetical protein